MALEPPDLFDPQLDASAVTALLNIVPKPPTGRAATLPTNGAFPLPPVDSGNSERKKEIEALRKERTMLENQLRTALQGNNVRATLGDTGPSLASQMIYNYELTRSVRGRRQKDSSSFTNTPNVEPDLPTERTPETPPIIGGPPPSGLETPENNPIIPPPTDPNAPNEILPPLTPKEEDEDNPNPSIY